MLLWQLFFTWRFEVFLGCKSTQCKLEKTPCRPATVVPSTNHKISLCKLRRLVDKNLDAVCELPVLLSLSSTLFLCLMSAWYSLSICKQKQVKPLSASWKPGILFQVENSELFTLKTVGQGSQESRHPDYPSDHWVTHFCSFLPLPKWMPMCSLHITTGPCFSIALMELDTLLEYISIL